MAVVNAAAGTSRSAQPLPAHLQNEVHRALSDLQAQRLLYPQQCAAAEAQGQGARQDAKWCAPSCCSRCLACIPLAAVLIGLCLASHLQAHAGSPGRCVQLCRSQERAGAGQPGCKVPHPPAARNAPGS